jgi:hypothetical protein
MSGPNQEDGAAAEQLQHSWKFAVKKLDDDIQQVESRKLGFGDVVAYELEVIKNSLFPMLVVFLGLAALLLPFYNYSQSAIAELNAQGFVASVDRVTELQLCPSAADPDDCLDPRFNQTYGVQEQFGQVYDGFLPTVVPYLPLTMFVIPIVFFIGLMVTMSTCAGPLGVGSDGKQSSDTDIWATGRLIRWVMLAGAVVFTAAQCMKSLGRIPSRVGSLLSIFALAVAFYGSYRGIVHKGKGDRNVCKGYIATSLGSGLMAIIVNQYIFKRVDSEAGLCILWAVWVVMGELIMGYWRLCVRRLDLEKVDTHVVCMLSIQGGTCINTMKRIPLLCLTQYSFIVVMNIVSFFLEVLNRITVVKRDTFFDKCIRRMKEEEMSWKKSTLHRQVYIHNEMLQEIFELIFPIPLAMILYAVQFNPVGVPVEVAPIVTNCVLQMLQEFCADGCAIYYGSKYQNKFYRVAATNMWNPYRFKLMTFLIGTSTFGVNGFFLYTYLRVGQTDGGAHITLV